MYTTRISPRMFLYIVVTLSVPTVALSQQPRLKLPYPAGTDYQCIQGEGGSRSHKSTNTFTRYALDFDTPNFNQNPIPQPVVAAAAGTAYFRDGGGGLGKQVKIQHGEYYTLYAHLSSIGITDGKRVVQGQEIGKEGTTGNSDGDHIHFSLHRGNANNKNGTDSSIQIQKLEVLRSTNPNQIDVLRGTEFVCGIKGAGDLMDGDVYLSNNNPISISSILSILLDSAIEEKIVYEESFDSNPNWITDQSENFYWNSENRTYFARTLNGRPDYTPNRFAYKQLNINNDRSFSIQWDQRISGISGYGMAFFGLMDDDHTVGPITRRGFPQIIPKSTLVFGLGGRNNTINQYGAGVGMSDGTNNGQGGTGGVLPSLQFNDWYTMKISFLREQNTVNIKFRNRDLSEYIFDFNRPIFSNERFSPTMNRVGIGIDPRGYLPDSIGDQFPEDFQETEFDNILVEYLN